MPVPRTVLAIPASTLLRADAKGNTGPFSKTCVARVEGDQLALPGAQGKAYLVEHRAPQIETKYVVIQAPHQLPDCSDQDNFIEKLLPASRTG